VNGWEGREKSEGGHSEKESYHLHDMFFLFLTRVGYCSLKNEPRKAEPVSVFV
jgi:hypothetical protein